MKEEGKKNILFVIYITAVVVLAVIYFTVPERQAFFDFQLKWWGEFWSLLKSFFN